MAQAAEAAQKNDRTGKHIVTGDMANICCYNFTLCAVTKVNNIVYEHTIEAPGQQKDDGLASTAIFEGARESVKSNPEAVKKTKAVFLWKVTKNGKIVTEWSKLLCCLTYSSTCCL